MEQFIATLLANPITLGLVIVLGFVILLLGAEGLVDGASSLAKQQVKPLPDTPAVIVNVFVKEEHHYHKGAFHLDFHDHFMAHLVSKLKFY